MSFRYTLIINGLQEDREIIFLVNFFCGSVLGTRKHTFILLHPDCSLRQRNTYVPGKSTMHAACNHLSCPVTFARACVIKRNDDQTRGEQKKAERGKKSLESDFFKDYSSRFHCFLF